MLDPQLCWLVQSTGTRFRRCLPLVLTVATIGNLTAICERGLLSLPPRPRSERPGDAQGLKAQQAAKQPCQVKERFANAPNGSSTMFQNQVSGSLCTSTVSDTC